MQRTETHYTTRYHIPQPSAKSPETDHLPAGPETLRLPRVLLLIHAPSGTLLTTLVRVDPPNPKSLLTDLYASTSSVNPSTRSFALLSINLVEASSCCQRFGRSEKLTCLVKAISRRNEST